MIEYIYFVKCPNCEDEHFYFFDEAKAFALDRLTQKPIITQTEVNRNDFGECTDHCDLGTVWSWEDMMQDTEFADTVFSKAETFGISEDLDAFDDFDIGTQIDEFDNIDNSLDFEIEEISNKKSITEDSMYVPRNPATQATRTPKDSDYVIVLKHPINKKHYFLSKDYTITTDINRAMTYSGKFSAEDEIKYAEDAADNYGFTFEVKIDTYQDDTYYDDYRSVNFFVTTVAEARKLLGVTDKTTSQDSLRKPIPEGMTIEQLVEEMEENEDEVECKWCGELFGKDQCRREIDLGWLCARCEAGIKSRGETLTFREYDYDDFLDESTAVPDSPNIGKYVRLVVANPKYRAAGTEYSLLELKSLLRVSKIAGLSNQGINLIVKFDNRCKVLQETDDGYLVLIPCYYRNQMDRSKIDEHPKYVRCWVPKAQTQFI